MVEMPKVIDIFAGAGGLSEGFRQVGFDVLAAIDFDPHSCQTFRQSHPETLVIEQAIEEVSLTDLLRSLEIKRGGLDVLVGGPPCQAFSVYNHRRGMHDERSGLFREYLRSVDEVMPRLVVMENVTGITSVEDGRAVTEITCKLRELGYSVEHKVLKAEEYGVPQERRRLFFIGSRDGEEITWPDVTHAPARMCDLFNGLIPFVTVKDAIDDLPRLEVCEGIEECSYDRPPLSAYQIELRQGSRVLYNHVAPALGDINLERLKYIPPGGSWRDIPHGLLPPGMQRAKRSDHTKRYGRLHPDGLSSTILTKCDLHWGAFIHYNQERTVTVREAARLQSFPDTIRFAGPRVEQYRQVGNAVPPVLARAVAATVAKMLRESKPRQVSDKTAQATG